MNKKIEISINKIRDSSGVAFGTSGVRGEISRMTDFVCYSYVQAFLKYIGTLGEFAPGDIVALGGDLRSSTPRILMACADAVQKLGGRPVFCGHVPTPALAAYSIAQKIPSLMVTGSHIPDDRNGIKFYRPQGEVLKGDEAGITSQHIVVNHELFDANDQLIAPASLPPITDVSEDYVARYVNFFGADALTGLRIGVYQHSAVGRDLLVRIVSELGGTPLVLGRSAHFIPVDTEAIRPEDTAAALSWAEKYATDAIISTDGDSDRPLLANEAGEWVRGDRLGILCAQALKADHVVTPITSNTALELVMDSNAVTRTRIGSPFVIEAMNAAIARGHKRVCGYEANGGFLLGSDITLDGRRLSALPTRDAVLPVVAALVAARKSGGLIALESNLPSRTTYSDRIERIAPNVLKKLFSYLLDSDSATANERLAISFSGSNNGLSVVDLTDGIRMTMADGTIIHLRGSGNSPELRCYTEASTFARARQANKQTLQAVLALLKLV
jgi:phosphomannomutase